MKRNVVVAALVAGTSFAQPVFGQAPVESRSWFEERLAAPRSALELSAGSAYTQGFGMLRGGVGMPSVATAGAAFEVGLGARIMPRWSVASVAHFSELTAERAAGVHAMTLGAAATYHLDPDARIDPWLEVGAGYRFLWETAEMASRSAVYRGIQLVRLRLGADLRLSQTVAIAPFVGADANVFWWEDAAGSAVIGSPRPSTFVAAGLQGRLDFDLIKR